MSFPSGYPPVEQEADQVKVNKPFYSPGFWMTILGGMLLASPFPFMKGSMAQFSFKYNRIGIGLVFGVLLAGILLRWWAIHSWVSSSP